MAWDSGISSILQTLIDDKKIIKGSWEFNYLLDNYRITSLPTDEITSSVNEYINNRGTLLVLEDSDIFLNNLFTYFNKSDIVESLLEFETGGDDVYDKFVMDDETIYTLNANNQPDTNPDDIIVVVPMINDPIINDDPIIYSGASIALEAKKKCDISFWVGYNNGPINATIEIYTNGAKVKSVEITSSSKTPISEEISDIHLEVGDKLTINYAYYGTNYVPTTGFTGRCVIDSIRIKNIEEGGGDVSQDTIVINSDKKIERYFFVNRDSYDYTFEFKNTLPNTNSPGWSSTSIGVSATKKNIYSMIELTAKYNCRILFTFWFNKPVNDVFDYVLIFLDGSMSEPIYNSKELNSFETHHDINLKQGQKLSIAYIKGGNRPNENGEIAQFYNVSIEVNVSNGIYLGVPKKVTVNNPSDLYNIGLSFSPGNVGSGIRFENSGGRFTLVNDGSAGDFDTAFGSLDTYLDRINATVMDVTIGYSGDLERGDEFRLFVQDGGSTIELVNELGHNISGECTITVGNWGYINPANGVYDKIYFDFVSPSGAIDQPMDFYIKSVTYTSTDSVARKVKNIYVGVNTEVPVMELVTNLRMSNSNRDLYFDVNNILEYTFIRDNTTENCWNAGNLGIDNSGADTRWVAKQDYEISFDYYCNSEPNYDKLTIYIYKAETGGVIAESIASGISGLNGVKHWSGVIKKGEMLRIAYIKDISGSATNESAWFGNVDISGMGQTGSEFKEVARKVKKAYIGVNGVARLCYVNQLVEHIKATKFSSSQI